MDADELREGIFALNTRRFGSVAEVLIQRLVKLGKAKTLFHDLYDDVRDHRVEVKFSRALKKSEVLVTEATVLECIESATSEERMVHSDELDGVKFDCNIQQIKKVEFEILYYGIFFFDCVMIFRIKSEEIGPQIYYSNKQHKGNEGEGQFHVNHDTLQIHLDNYLYRNLSYETLLDLLTPDSK